MAQKIRKFEYQWRWIRQICTNPNHPKYPIYGGAGIECYWGKKEYPEFENFILNKLGPRPVGAVLGRKDKFGDFAPKNLYWESPKQRSNNNPRQNTIVAYQRRRQTISRWSEELRIPYYMIRRRLANGMPLKDIIKELL